MRTLLLAGIALVLLAGCGDDGGSDGGGGEKPATLTGPVTYERGGGVAGRRDRLVVRARRQGEAHRPDGRRSRSSSATPSSPTSSASSPRRT